MKIFKEKCLAKKNGITLIVLVITIVVLLILATITILELRNTKLFNKTIDTKNKYKKAELNQTNILNVYVNKIDEIHSLNKVTEKKYYIKYDGNGATNGNMTNSECIMGKKNKLSKNIYEKSGCDFAGWSTEPNGDVKFTNESELHNDLTSDENKVITLYAQWKNQKVYLYNSDDIGLWVQSFNLYPGGGYSFIANATSLSIVGTSSTNCGEYFATRSDKKYNLSKYNKLCFDLIAVKNSSAYGTYGFISFVPNLPTANSRSETNNVWGYYIAKSNVTHMGHYEIDIDKKTNQEVYARVCGYAGGAGITLTSIWLE